jgi:hypothetical protein
MEDSMVHGEGPFPAGPAANEREGVWLLGQWIGYPRTWPGGVTAIGVLATLLAAVIVLPIVWSDADFKKVEQHARIIWAGEEKVGDENTRGYMVELQFWTPSVETADDLRTYAENAKSAVEKSKEWELHVSDEKLAAFGESLLKELRRQPGDGSGYHRDLVKGVGSTGVLKSGWWWTVTIPGDRPNDAARSLIKIYMRELGARDKVFIKARVVESGYLSATP